MHERARASEPTPGRHDWRGALARALVAPVKGLAAEMLAAVLLCPLLLSVAIWNRFPIIFYDTGAYLLEGLGRVFLAERSPVYSLLLDYTGASASLWIVALLQALMTAFVIVQTQRAVAPRIGLGVLFGTVAILVLLTGLPWYVGQIEPDCFAAIAVLSFYLLAFHPEPIAGWRGRALVAIAALAISAHSSHLLLGAGLFLSIFTYRLAQKLFRADDWPRVALLRPAVSCVLGLLLIVGSNDVLTGKLFVSRAGPSFVFARLLQDGIVMRLLDDTCPKSGYRLCAYKAVLPRTADQWLWGRASPFLDMNRFEGTNAESTRIIWDSLARYPALQAEWAISDAVRQFGMFKTGDQIEPQEWILSRPLGQFVPNQIHAYLSARQQQGEFDFRPINRIDVPVGWLSLAGLSLALAAALRRRHRKRALFFGFVLAALAGNAAICGALSNPHDRYQSRVIWLAPFALLLIAGDQPIFALRGWGESGT
jgi:hypothetical protein